MARKTKSQLEQEVAVLITQNIMLQNRITELTTKHSERSGFNSKGSRKTHTVPQNQKPKGARREEMDAARAEAVRTGRTVAL